MPEAQLRLFAAPKPLLERLGSEFFRAVPSCPGVYLMFGVDGRVLYVGQSGNLRARLGSYKNARPETASRKVIRLIHLTADVRWEECLSAAAARLRENDLLRTYRPKFNSANTYPQAYPYLSLSLREAAFRLSLGPRQDPAAENFGAFKSRGWSAYAALVRLLFCLAHRPLDLARWPCRLLSERPPKRMTFPLEQPDSSPLLPHLRQFLEGRSPELVDFLRQRLPNASDQSHFEQSLRQNDLQSLNDFFERTAQRNFQLRMRFGRTETALEQTELDDLLVLS